MNRLIQDHALEVGGEGANYYMAQARLCDAMRCYARPEFGARRAWPCSPSSSNAQRSARLGVKTPRKAILLDHNELDEALAMYQVRQ